MPRDGSNVYHRPPGTDAVSNATISSAAYNVWVADVEQDLNLPRPIVAGGTGATNADAALIAMNGEKAKQVVTNYDTMTFLSGSFSSDTTATNPPVAGRTFSGIAYIYTPDSTYGFIEARDFIDGTKYYRKLYAGTWGAWVSDSSSTGGSGYVLKAGDTMTGQLKNTANIFIGAGTAPSPMMSGALIGANISSNSGAYFWNAHYNGSNNVNLASGYSAYQWLDIGTGNWYFDIGSSVAAGAAGTYNHALTMDSNGNATLARGTLRQQGGRIVSTSATPAAIATYTGGAVNTAMGMWVDTANRLSFGVTDSSGNPGALAGYLDTGGNLTIIGATATKASGTAWVNPSDARIKQDVQAYGAGLEQVCALAPVTFRFKPGTGFDDRQHIGLIAQEVEHLMPEMVTKQEAKIGEHRYDDFRMLDASALTFALINSCKELAARVIALEEQIAVMEK
jgi:hypothetical protein